MRSPARVKIPAIATRPAETAQQDQWCGRDEDARSDPKGCALSSRRRCRDRGDRRGGRVVGGDASRAARLPGHGRGGLLGHGGPPISGAGWIERADHHLRSDARDGLVRHRRPGRTPRAAQRRHGGRGHPRHATTGRPVGLHREFSPLKVDPSGAVWLANNDRLLRYDPTSGKLAGIVLASKVAGALPGATSGSNCRARGPAGWAFCTG